MTSSFNQRFGVRTSVIAENSFPDQARNGLMFILNILVDKSVLGSYHDSKSSWATLANELSRIMKVGFSEPSLAKHDSSTFNSLLLDAKWNDIFVFIERVFSHIIQDAIQYGYNDSIEVTISREEARKLFCEEIQNLMSEEGFPYQFTDGIFHRHGRIQTQKNIAKALAILDDPKLKQVRAHYLKALNFYTSRENPDFENSVKDSLCALEMSAEVLSGQPISKDFTKEMQKLEGKEDERIPSPLVQSMIKLFAYRGNGSGVAHGIPNGFRVTKAESELVLSITAAYITYLYDFFDQRKEDELF